ncbi:MAG: hypothetical protein ACR2RE_12090 [Geminicoccaceae bacterium]
MTHVRHLRALQAFDLEMLIDIHKAYPIKSEAFRRAQEAIDAIE